MTLSSLWSRAIRGLRRQAVLAYVKMHPFPDDLPERVVREPDDGSPLATLIWLHGVGTTTRRFLEKCRPPQCPRLRVVALQAPMRPGSIFRGHRMPMWADMMPNGARPARTNMQHLEESAARVHDEMDRQQRDGVESIVVGGHSQGGCLALFAALTHHRPVAAVISLSGFLPPEAQSRLDERADTAMFGAPMFLAHGTLDSVIPSVHAESTRSWLARRGARVEWYRGPYGHSRRPAEESAACEAFLHARLDRSPR